MDETEDVVREALKAINRAKRERDGDFARSMDYGVPLLDALRVIVALMVDQEDAPRHNELHDGDCIWCDGHGEYLYEPSRWGFVHVPDCAWVRAKHFLATGELK